MRSNEHQYQNINVVASYGMTVMPVTL